MSQEDKLYNLLIKVSQHIVKEGSKDENKLLSRIAHCIVEVTSKDENDAIQTKQEPVREGMKTETDIIEIKTLKSFKGLDSLKGINDLPEIITAQHIADYLHIARQSVYELFRTNPQYGGIPFFSIGTAKRVKRSDFIAWIKGRKETSGWDKNL